jgi:hypothetical protein
MFLAEIYVNHGEALEADLLHYWNQDINLISLRRMRNLLERLPYNSEVHLDYNEVPFEARQWSIDTHMKANLIDAVRAMDWHLIAVNTKNPPKPPKPIYRPETVKKITPEKKPKGYWPGRTIIDKGATDVAS